MKKIHVCLVSAQLIPNLIPILMDSIENVVLISTKKMKGLANRLKKILEDKNTNVRIYNYSAPSSGINGITDYANSIYDKISKDYQNREIVLNLTGGTKLMVLGIWDSHLRKNAKQVIYTDTQENRIEYLFSDNNNLHQDIYRDLDSVMNIPLYLKCYGAEYIRAESDNKLWREHLERNIHITCAIGKNATKFSGFFKLINALTHKAIDSDKKVVSNPKQQIEFQLNRFQKQTLKTFQEAGLLVFENSNTIEFKDYKSALYLGGFWLEEYVYDCIRKLNPDDVRSGVTVSQKDSVKNEFDTLVVHNNRLLLIECKTARMDEKEVDFFYKLDSLAKSLKGIFGSALLVTLQKPSVYLRNRAENQKICIIDTEKLPYISEYIQDWMENLDLFS
ncbi:DUF1887 family protein [bacterium]|nr:DUF1887 family protein [bacterium]